MTGPVGTKVADQQSQQAPCEPAAAPLVTVQHSMVVGKVRVPVEADNAQGGGYGAASRGQDGTDDQHQHVLPGRCVKARLERLHPSGQSGRYEPA